MLINVPPNNSVCYTVMMMILCRYVIILTIISNCVVMSMDEHLPFGDKTVLAKQLVTIVIVIMALSVHGSDRHPLIALCLKTYYYKAH